MGAQWKQKWRELSAHRRGQLFGKIVKEIQVAARMGDPDPDLNARLSAALETARKHSVPRDTIERAIKKGAGLLEEKVNYETVTYEGFAPHRVPVIVECLTDNRNRTAPEMRVLFKKGQMGSSGSVAFLFERTGLIEAANPTAGLDIEEAAILADAQEVEPMDADQGETGTHARFLCDPASLDTVSRALREAGWAVSKSELGFQAKNFPELDGAAHAEVIEFLTALDDHEDVHRVYAAVKPE